MVLRANRLCPGRPEAHVDSILRECFEGGAAVNFRRLRLLDDGGPSGGAQTLLGLLQCLSDLIHVSDYLG